MQSMTRTFQNMFVTLAGNNMDYKHAIKTPKEGWAHAKGDNMLALWAEQLSSMLCVRAEALYNWSKKHNEDLQTIFEGIAQKKIDSNLIVVALINDIPRTDPSLYPF